jgi:hypothetical protein
VCPRNGEIIHHLQFGYDHKRLHHTIIAIRLTHMPGIPKHTSRKPALFLSEEGMLRRRPNLFVVDRQMLNQRIVVREHGSHSIAADAARRFIIGQHLVTTWMSLMGSSPASVATCRSHFAQGSSRSPDTLAAHADELPLDAMSEHALDQIETALKALRHSFARRAAEAQIDRATAD